jgi:hypothetical protein
MEKSEMLDLQIANLENEIKQIHATLGEIKGSVLVLRDRVDINSKEISQLHLEINKPKKWWKNVTTVISILAVLISASSTIWTVRSQNINKEYGIRMRVKDIVKRLSEIQVSFANAGSNKANIENIYFQEISDLVDEAVAISNSDNKYLNDAEYSTIISMALINNKPEVLDGLFINALKSIRSVSAEFAIKNYLASYNFKIKNNPKKGREIMTDIIGIYQKQAMPSDLKTADIALEYTIWCELEYQTRNLTKADSVLKIAENLVVNAADALRYNVYPVQERIKGDRLVLEKSQH